MNSKPQTTIPAAIIFCLFKYFPYGGLQRDCLCVAKECQRRGHPIRIYTLSWDGPIPSGFDVRIVPVRAWSNHCRIKKYFRWMEKELKKIPNLRVVGFNKMPRLDIYYAADACYKEKALTQRGPTYRLGRRYRLYSKLEKTVFGRNSKTEILMISKTQKPFFVKHYGTPSERMHFLPPNISKDRIAPANADKIRIAFRRKNGVKNETNWIIQIGSGFITKGVDRSIRAIAALPKAIQQRTILWIVGNDHKKRFERIAKKLKIRNRVIFTGGRDDIPNILLGADLMMHPAYSENTGMTLLEAVVAGLPVLCTAVCDYSSHITAGKCGIVIPEPFQQKNLNHQLKTLLTERFLPTFKKNALVYAQSTDLYSMHQRAADIIVETVEHQGILDKPQTHLFRETKA